MYQCAFGVHPTSNLAVLWKTYSHLVDLSWWWSHCRNPTLNQKFEIGRLEKRGQGLMDQSLMDQGLETQEQKWEVRVHQENFVLKEQKEDQLHLDSWARVLAWAWANRGAKFQSLLFAKKAETPWGKHNHEVGYFHKHHLFNFENKFSWELREFHQNYF